MMRQDRSCGSRGGEMTELQACQYAAVHLGDHLKHCVLGRWYVMKANSAVVLHDSTSSTLLLVVLGSHNCTTPLRRVQATSKTYLSLRPPFARLESSVARCSAHLGRNDQVSGPSSRQAHCPFEFRTPSLAWCTCQPLRDH
jgi:hypothetical protein